MQQARFRAWASLAVLPRRSCFCDLCGFWTGSRCSIRHRVPVRRVVVGLEIPLAITRILTAMGAASTRWRNVLTADYSGRAGGRAWRFRCWWLPQLWLDVGVAGVCLPEFAGRQDIPVAIFGRCSAGAFASSGRLNVASARLPSVRAERSVGAGCGHFTRDEVIVFANHALPADHPSRGSATATRACFLTNRSNSIALDEHRYPKCSCIPPLARIAGRARLGCWAGADGHGGA